jgi:sugar/nucleoside kinase (ribokinase family)
VLCVGIAVQDIVFRVAQFPPPGGKCMTNDFAVVAGGCAVNAAIAVARLGGRAAYAGPLGHPGDAISNQLIDQMTREGVGTIGVVRVPEATAPVSGIMVDGTGERMIATHRDKRIEAARITDPDRLVEGVSVPTGRRSRTIRCFWCRRTSCSRRNACAPPPARTTWRPGCCG